MYVVTRIPLLTLNSLWDNMKTLAEWFSKELNTSAWCFLKSVITVEQEDTEHSVPQYVRTAEFFKFLSDFTGSPFWAEPQTREVGYSAFLLFESPINDKVEHPCLEHVICFPFGSQTESAF